MSSSHTSHRLARVDSFWPVSCCACILCAHAAYTRRPARHPPSLGDLRPYEMANVDFIIDNDDPWVTSIISNHPIHPSIHQSKSRKAPQQPTPPQWPVWHICRSVYELVLTFNYVLSTWWIWWSCWVLMVLMLVQESLALLIPQVGLAGGTSFQVGIQLGATAQSAMRKGETMTVDIRRSISRYIHRSRTDTGTVIFE